MEEVGVRPWVHSALHHSALGTPSTPAPPLPCSKRGHTLSLFNSNNKRATSSKVRFGLRGTSFLHFKDFQRRQPVVSPYSSLSLAQSGSALLQLTYLCPASGSTQEDCSSPLKLWQHFKVSRASVQFPGKKWEKNWKEESLSTGAEGPWRFLGYPAPPAVH